MIGSFLCSYWVSCTLSFGSSELGMVVCLKVLLSGGTGCTNSLLLVEGEFRSTSEGIEEMCGNPMAHGALG